MKTQIFWILLLPVTAVALNSSAEAISLSSNGKAIDAKVLQPQQNGMQLTRTIKFSGFSQANGKKLFVGTETLKEDEENYLKETKYYSLDNNLLYSDRTLYLKSSLGMLNFEINNGVSGYNLESSYSSKQKSYTTVIKEKAKAKGQTSTQKASSPLIVPKALQESVTKNWDALAKNQKVEFELFVPEKETTVGFKLDLAIKKDEALVKLLAQSWLFRMFVPNIKFTFGTKKPYPVLSYTGPGLFKVDGKETGEIRIDFDQQAESTATSAH